MSSKTGMRGCLAILLLAFIACGDGQTPEDGAGETATEAADPWAVPPPPPDSVYDGPLFELNHDYPTEPVSPPDPTPWQMAINNGPITVQNAGAYVEALKEYIADDMQTLLFDYEDWDPAETGWYSMPWLDSVMEPIRGSYVGSSFDPDMFPKSGLKMPMTTHVVVYYDDVAATSLQNVWETSGMDPVPGITSGGVQFPEGSIVVKPAATTADGAAWPPMEGASPWQIYAAAGDGDGDPKLQDVSLFQFDIIVKDSQSAGESQWVFTTLVYDTDAPGDAWDKLVPLGAMWGNDPGVISRQGCDPLGAPASSGACPVLSQTWINPVAPVYSTETLGWGGRLSGPNDGSVDTQAAVLTPNGPQNYDGRYAMSSCMSCHGPAEYQTESFLLPVPSTCQEDECSPQTTGSGPDTRLVYYQSGSDDFMKWFQSRPGNVPQDEGTSALDYDMNYAFKAIPEWFEATNQEGNMKFIEAFNDYRGIGRSVIQRLSPAPSPTAGS